MTGRFVLITGRTKEQGQARHVGKNSPAYRQATSWIELNASDMARLGIEEGQVVHAGTSAGQAELTVRVGALPTGVAFVPVGPAASILSGAETGGTGMPGLKGMLVVITPEPRQPCLEVR